MLIIELDRGLGNQMFQYAFYARLKSMGKQVVFKKSYTREEVIQNGDNEVSEVYDVECPLVTEGDYEKLLRKSRSISYRIKYKMGLADALFVEEKPFYSEYNEMFLKYDDAFLSGYWQTEKYFIDIKDEIMNAFIPRNGFNSGCKQMINRLNADGASVSVHVRLGDYLEHKNRIVYGNICTKEYYRTALAYMKNRIDSPRFYIFSNNLKEAAEMFENEDVVFVDCNKLADGWADICLMSLCKHHIVANSSFSWWGAYLDKKEEKMVIAPQKWVNTYPMPDICPDGWIRV